MAFLSSSALICLHLNKVIMMRTCRMISPATVEGAVFCLLTCVCVSLSNAVVWNHLHVDSGKTHHRPQPTGWKPLPVCLDIHRHHSDRLLFPLSLMYLGALIVPTYGDYTVCQTYCSLLCFQRWSNPSWRDMMSIWAEVNVRRYVAMYIVLLFIICLPFSFLVIFALRRSVTTFAQLSV